MERNMTDEELIEWGLLLEGQTQQLAELAYRLELELADAYERIAHLKRQLK